MKKVYQLLIISIVICVALIALYQLGIAHYLSLEFIQSKSALLQQHVADYYAGMVAAYIAVFTALLALSLPVAGPLGVVGGFLFGTIQGFLFAMIVIWLGTSISFLMIRHTLSRIARMQYKAQLDSFNAQMNQYGFSYLISLHFLSIVPYFLINTLAALSEIPLTTFMWTTVLGAIPSIFIYVFAGQQLHAIKSWGDIVSGNMLIVLALLALLAILPTIISRFNTRK